MVCATRIARIGPADRRWSRAGGSSGTSRETRREPRLNKASDRVPAGQGVLTRRGTVLVRMIAAKSEQTKKRQFGTDRMQSGLQQFAQRNTDIEPKKRAQHPVITDLLSFCVMRYSDVGLDDHFRFETVAGDEEACDWPSHKRGDHEPQRRAGDPISLAFEMPCFSTNVGGHAMSCRVLPIEKRTRREVRLDGRAPARSPQRCRSNSEEAYTRSSGSRGSATEHPQPKAF